MNNKNNKKNIIVVGLLLTFAIGFLIAGCALIGVGFKNFDVYVKLSSYCSSHGLNFYEQLGVYNSQPGIANGIWTKASIDLFVPGLVLSIIGVAATAISIVFVKKNKVTLEKKDKSKKIEKVISKKQMKNEEFNKER